MTFVSPFIVFASNILINRARKARSFKRIESDPLLFVGARIERLILEGTGTILESAVIDKIEFGWVEVATPDGRRVSFTGIEFEKLHPIMKADPPRRQNDGKA